MVVKLPNLIQLLKTRGFTNQVPYTLSGKLYYFHEYGTPGTFLRHNIKQQWWKAMVHLQSNVFSVETSPLQLGNLMSLMNSCEDIQKEKDFSKVLRSSLKNDCRNKYLDVLTLANSRLPFSITSIGECFCPQASDCDMNNQEREFFLRCSVTTEMLLQNYVPPSGVSRIFDYWLQLRLSWWKKFSKNPSKLKVTSSSTGDDNGLEDRTTDSSSNHNGGHRMSIVYEFPWGSEVLEVIHNVGDEDLKRLQGKEETRYLAKVSGTKRCLPHCIQCTANLEMAMAAFLVDGFHERKSVTKSKSKTQNISILQLHPHLAPFHVALVATASQASTLKELRHISKQLEQDLLNAGVSVFNASEHVGTLNAHFKRNDQLGVPYTLVLNENSLKDGVISSRDRDTEVKKPVHVSKAVEEISRNVKAALE